MVPEILNWCKRLISATIGKQQATRQDFFPLLQLCVLRFGFFRDGDVGVLETAIGGNVVYEASARPRTKSGGNAWTGGRTPVGGAKLSTA
jgi:hypothetical protein